jgi:RNA polymerase sigma-70 factor (ECF subfamily)
MPEGSTVRLQDCLDRLRTGDPAARDELLGAACERLTRLARKMLRADGRLQRWEQTDDVLQSALLRLCRALRETQPASPREFYRLAALQVRRELIDLARHHYGPEGSAANRETNARAGGTDQPPVLDPPDGRDDPKELAAWVELHRRAATLPEEEREVFDAVWYQGLAPAEAAVVLGVSARTVRRRWQAACLRLHDAFHGHLPGL